MKRILMLIPLIFIGCSHDTIETKLKLYYVDGKTEIVTIKRHSHVMYKHDVFNGCLYRVKRDRAYETEYDGQMRCGIHYYKTLSVKTIPNKQPLHKR